MDSITLQNGTYLIIDNLNQINAYEFIYNFMRKNVSHNYLIFTTRLTHNYNLWAKNVEIIREFSDDILRHHIENHKRVNSNNDTNLTVIMDSVYSPVLDKSYYFKNILHHGNLFKINLLFNYPDPKFLSSEIRKLFCYYVFVDYDNYKLYPELSHQLFKVKVLSFSLHMPNSDYVINHMGDKLIYGDFENKIEISFCSDGDNGDNDDDNDDDNLKNSNESLGSSIEKIEIEEPKPSSGWLKWIGLG